MFRNLLFILAVALVLSFVFFAGSLNPDVSINAPSLPSLRGDEAVESLKQQGLYDSLQHALDGTRYRVSLENGSKDPESVYRAPNPAQGFDALFTSKGVSIKPRRAANQAPQPSSWQTSVSLIGYGYKNDFVSLTAPALEARDNRIELRHAPVDAPDRAVTEWYVNRAEGLEQGFVIHTQPSNKIEGERLRVVMKLSGC